MRETGNRLFRPEDLICKVNHSRVASGWSGTHGTVKTAVIMIM
jgi:hypothetical protein